MIMRFMFVLFSGIAAILLASCVNGNIGKNLDLRRAIFILRDADDDKLKEATRAQYQAGRLLFDQTDPFDHRGIYLGLLKHRNWWLRYWAADTIGSHAPRHSEEVSVDDPFRKALLAMAQNDPVLEVRTEAIYALNYPLGDMSDCQWLLRLYTSEPAGNPEMKDISSAPYGYKRALADLLSKCPGTEKLLAPKDMDIPTIMKIFGNADPDAFFQGRTKEQKEADRALDRKDPAAIFDELLPYLNHPNPVVRNRVIDIGRIKTTRGLSTFGKHASQRSIDQHSLHYDRRTRSLGRPTCLRRVFPPVQGGVVWNRIAPLPGV